MFLGTQKGLKKALSVSYYSGNEQLYVHPLRDPKLIQKKNTSAELLDSIYPYIVGSRGASQLGGIF